MATKLTLRIDENLIAHAKTYSRAQGKSVSRLVSDYFAALPTEAAGATAATPTPLVDSLRGVLKGTGLDRGDYLRHLERKHR